MFNFNEDTYLRGYLRTAYVFASFLLIIVMLNVLIALMGTSQSERAAVTTEIK